jgi:hypothetical protein
LVSEPTTGLLGGFVFVYAARSVFTLRFALLTFWGNGCPRPADAGDRIRIAHAIHLTVGANLKRHLDDASTTLFAAAATDPSAVLTCRNTSGRRGGAIRRRGAGRRFVNHSVDITIVVNAIAAFRCSWVNLIVGVVAIHLALTKRFAAITSLSVLRVYG